MLTIKVTPEELEAILDSIDLIYSYNPKNYSKYYIEWVDELYYKLDEIYVEEYLEYEEIENAKDN